ncbi:BapA/Bap/LapF family large adhesin [Sphingomonas turrisvirgatae]|nr:BapA/Bap/LapF family large adhesin [Sphingomonas turrisvirgatae]
MGAQTTGTAEIIDKATGTVTRTPVEAIDLNGASVVRLAIERSQIADVARDGDDLLLRLSDGREIRIADYFDDSGQPISDLVLRESDGKQWLAQLNRDGTRYSAIEDATELVAGAGGPGGSSLAPVLLGLLGAGGGAAALSGGGGGSDDRANGGSGPGNGADTQPPAAPTATINATGTTVSGTGEAGASVEVRNAAGAVIGRGQVGTNGNYSVAVDQAQANGERLSVVQTDAAGNASPPATLTAPDITAPAAPSLTIASDGASAAGTGEPGATVTVRDGTGTIIGSAVVGADGNVTIPLSPPQANGGTLPAVQTDAAGNASSAATLTAPDITAPAAPSLTIASDGAGVTGTGEPGATITVRDGTGAIIGSAVVGADGNVTIPLSPPQANGGTLTAVQTDAAGNASPAATLAAPDITAPAAPSLTIAPDGASVTGTDEPGATVTVRDEDGNVVGSANVGADGSFSVTLAPPLLNGEVLTAVQTDAAGNNSAESTATAPDLTVPAAPVVTVAPDGTAVTGTGEAGATVTVTDTNGAVLGTGVVQGDGSFTVPLAPPQANGETVTVVQTDAAGNVSPPVSAVAPDITAPPAPTLVISADGTTVSGTGVPGLSVTVADPDGNVIARVRVRADGTFTTALTPPQVDGEAVSAVQADAAGNISPQATVTAPDLTAPAVLAATVNADGTAVVGTGEPGAIVTVTAAGGATLGSVVADALGNFTVPLTPAQANGEAITVVQRDAAGNFPPPLPLIAPDITGPSAPAAMIDATGTVVSGLGEPNATIIVRNADNTVLATGTATASGAFSIPLPTAQIDSQALAVTQADAAGNESLATALTAPDLTAPAAPTATVAADGGTVNGSGEAGATIIVTDPIGVEIGRGTVQGDGTYGVTLTPPQIDGEMLGVTQTDSAANVSPQTNTVAPDLIVSDAPDAPTAFVSADGLTVSGVGEAGALVSVTGPNGVPLGTATAGVDGSYSVTLTTPQRNGESLRVVQPEAEGDRSPPATAIAPALPAPAAPTATLDAAGVSVSGTGEPAATITITGPGGGVIGTATVDARGNYSSVLATPQTNGETLSVAQTDAAANVSPAITLIAPDFTAPAAPAATIAADGASVTGTGEPGATVTVRAASGTVLGTSTVGVDGSYTAPLSPAQVNNQPLSVTQSDAAGNQSPATGLTAPDLTPPAAPTISVTADGTAVSGLGEAGAAIRITDPAGTVIGTATVAANGTYVAALNPAQVNGQLLTAVQSDAAGNSSAPVSTIAPDLVAPDAPAIAISADGSVATGTGEPGASIVVTDAAGTVVGAGDVAANGAFTIGLSPPQANGQVLTAVQSDAAGNSSPPVTLTAPDITAPAIPTGTISPDGLQVTGTGEAGATVSVTNGAGTSLGSAQVQPDGSYVVTLTPPQTNGEALSVRQSDAGGNVSPAAALTAPDLTAPGAPGATVAPDGASVTGTGEPGASVTIRAADGSVVGTATVGADGNYIATLSPVQANGGTLSVVQTDAAGNASPTTVVAAPDITAPTAPVATVGPDGTTVTGTGEPGTSVTVTSSTGTPLGTSTVAADGSFTVPIAPAQANGELVRVTLTDAAGNASPATAVRAPDITAPGAPAATVSPDGTQVSGTGEPGATVTISGPGGVLGTAVVSPSGSYVATLTPPQIDGETLTVTQRDAAGNLSPSISVVAPDGTAPNVPTAAVTADGSAVVGTGVAGSTISVTGPDGTVIGTATVAGDGSYTATLTTPQRNGELLGVTQADGSGNVSPRVPALAPDLTAPNAPTLIVAGDGATVSGTGEAGATVTIRNGAGAVIGSAVVAADGSYAAALTPAQANGGTLTATQADTAGNISLPVSAAAPDITAPLAPTGVAITPDGATVTGTGEAGATVTVRNPAGTVIGTGTVAGDGSFSIGLTTPQVTGATLSVRQADAAGNQSPAVPLISPFDIAAFDNSDTVGVDLLPVTSAVDFGSANYLALVSLGLLNLDANVLGTPSVSFTVAPGHTLDATFNYDAVLSLGAASGYAVVVQRFDGTQWVAVDGNGTNSLLQLRLLSGDLSSTASFGPGQYRAFVTFQGAAGVGVLGSLSVTGTDADFTEIGGVVPRITTGNVITDPGPGGQIDIVSSQTVVTSVTIGGITTSIVADGTVVDGAFGTLTINRNGSYSYTPDASASVIGQTETIGYTLLDPSDGETESAALSIAITSSDVTAAPVATDDSDIATVTYRNVETTLPPALEFSFSTPGALVLPVTRSGSDSFTVAANTVSDVTITAVRTGLLSVLPSYTITVTDAATGTVVRTVTQTAVAGLPLGSGVTVTLPDLPAGSYNFTVSSTNVIGTGYDTSVYVGQTVTYLNDFTVATTGPAAGSLLANDTAGTDFVTVRVDTGAGFVEVGDAGLTVNGSYGLLTLDEVGNYVYQPSATLGYSATDLLDSFTYQIVQPNGVVSTATLTVTVDVPADGLLPQGGGADVVTLDAMVLGPIEADPIVVAEAPQPFSIDLVEDQAELDQVLATYLDVNDPANGVSGSGGALAASPLDVAVDLTAGGPLDYLVLPSDLEHNRPEHVLQY